MAKEFSIAASSRGNQTQGVWWKSNSEFTVKYNSPIELEQSELSRWYVACAEVTYKNSRANLTAAFKNNKFYYNNGATDKVITIWDGNWNVQQLNDYIKATIKENGDNLPGDLAPITIGYNGPTLKVIISVAAGYSVTFPPGDTLNKNLGINEGVTITGPSAYIGDSIADLDRGVDMMHVICDLVDGSESVRFNGNADNYLYSVTIDGPPGATVKSEPFNLRWQPMARSTKGTISQITFNIKDSTGADYGSQTPMNIVLTFKRERVTD